MSMPGFYPSNRERNHYADPNTLHSAPLSSAVLVDANRSLVLNQLRPISLETPVTLELGDLATRSFTHQMDSYIFGNQQSLRQYRTIMDSIEKKWPALTNLINTHQTDRVAVFLITDDILLQNGMGGVWGPYASTDPRLKQFNAAIVIDTNRSQASIKYTGHEWFHEIQSINHTVKSGKSPLKSPISLSAYLSAQDAQEVVDCWLKGFQKNNSAPFSQNDPRHLIYKKPAIYLNKYTQTGTKECLDEFLHEIGAYMTSARLEHGHEAIQEHAKELGELIDQKLGIKAFTDPCPAKFKTRCLSFLKRSVGRILGTIGLALDVYHEYKHLPDTEPNKNAHALINGTARSLVNGALFLTPLNESLFCETSHLGSASEAAKKIEETVGRDKLNQILLRGFAAIGQEVPIDGLVGEERDIYNLYMNASTRNIQESLQNPFTTLYDTVKQSISNYITRFSADPKRFQEAVNTFGAEIKAQLSTSNVWDTNQQVQLAETLRSRGEEILKSVPKATAGPNETSSLVSENTNPKPEFISSPKEQQFRRWMHDFKNNNEATMKICIQGVAEDFLKDNQPLTDEQLIAIENELDIGNQQVFSKLEEQSQLGKVICEELTAKCGNQKTGEYFQKITEGIAQYTATLYLDGQRRLAQKKFEMQHEQTLQEFDQKSKESKTLHYQEITALSLPSIERSVWNVLHPSGDFGKSLKDMDHYLNESRAREKEIRELIHEKRKIKKGLNKQDSRLDKIDSQIRLKYEALLDERNKAIKKNNKAQKNLGIMSSFFSVAALIPPLTPFVGGAAAISNIASQGVGMGTTHHENRRMKIESRYINEMNRVQTVRNGLAHQSYQQTSDIFTLTQQITHERIQRAQIMQSNISINPAELREQLYKDRTEIGKEIEETQHAKQQVDNAIQDLQEKIKNYDEGLDEEQILAHRNTAEETINEQTKHRARKDVLNRFNYNRRSLKKDNDKGNKTPNPTNENDTSIQRYIYYRFLARADKSPMRLNRAEAQLLLSELQNESTKLEKNLTTLNQEQVENQTAIEREESLAKLKDAAYVSILGELNKYTPTDKDAVETQKFYDELFSAYHNLRNRERTPVLGTLNAFEGLFQEIFNNPVVKAVLGVMLPTWKKEGTIEKAPIYFQSISKLGEHSYKLYDSYLNFKFAHDQLTLIRKEFNPHYIDPLADPIETITNTHNWLESKGLLKCLDLFPNDQALQKFGPLRYLQEILVPAISIATGTLACVRIINHIAHGCPRVLSPEEIKLDEIKNFLIEFKTNLVTNLDIIFNQIDKNHKVIVDNILIMRSELGILGNEIIAEVDYARRQIISKQEEIHSINRTAAIKDKGNEIAKKLTALELSVQTDSATLEKIQDFFKETYLSLKHDTCLDINTGIFSGNGGTVVPMITMQNALKNPDIYSGLIAHHANFKKPLGCLYLYHLIYKNFQRGTKLAAPFLNGSENILSKSISECAVMLETQGKNFKEFFGLVDKIIHNCRNVQDEALKDMQTKIGSIGLFKNISIQTSLNQERTRFSKALTTDPHYVGAQKFRFAKIFCSTPINETEEPQTSGATKQFFSDAGILSAGNTLLTAGGLLVLGPGALLVGAAGGAYCLVKGANSALNYSTSNELKRKHDDLTLQDELKREVSTVPQRSFYLFGPNNERLLRTVWLNAEGELCSKISRVGGGVIWKTDIGSSSQSYKDSEGKRPLDITFELLEKNIKIINNKGLITVNEIKNLNPAYHLPPCEEYDTALMKLLSDYELWLDPSASIQESNQFYSIQNHSQFLCSSDYKTVPLAFPNELLKELENRMDPDRIFMEAAGIGFLEPSYSFTKDDYRNCYTLSIQYHFIDNQNEKRLYETFEVAYLDENAVKAFIKPSFSNTKKTNEPNLNELLIQMMYTNDKVGAPGDQTISLGENRWVAPSMRPFPGFFKLLNRYPECAVHFNSQLYSEVMSLCLKHYTNSNHAVVITHLRKRADLMLMLRRSRSTKTGCNIAVWKTIRESKKDLNQISLRLEENYNLLIAYCKLISNLDSFSLRQKLEKDFGILDPSHFNSLYDLIVGGIKLPEIKDDVLAVFKETLKWLPSEYLKAISTDYNSTTMTALPANTSSIQLSQALTLQQMPDPTNGIDQGNPSEQRNNPYYQYSGTDIEVIQTFLFEDEHAALFLSPMNYNQLNESSETIKEMLDEKKPILFTYNPNGGHWVAVAIIPTAIKKVTILYKDSMGRSDQSIKPIFSNDYTVDFVHNSAEEQINDVACGMYALDNLRTMVYYLKSDKSKSFISNFKTFNEFCSSEKVKGLRKKEFADAYKKGQALIESHQQKFLEWRHSIATKHQKEIDIIAKKLRQSFPSRTVISVKADENVNKSDHANTIFVEFALKSNKIENNSYEYDYRIFGSTDLSADDLKSVISEQGLDLESEGYVIEDQVIKIPSLRLELICSLAESNQKEVNYIAKKLRQSFPSRTVISVKADENVNKSDYTNTLFVEFALKSCQFKSWSLQYGFRIFGSTDLSPDDLKSIISEQGLNLESEDYVIEDQVIKIPFQTANKKIFVFNGPRFLD